MKQELSDLENIKKLGDFFDQIKNNNIKFKIPNYQRTYAWEDENAEILLNDLIKNPKNINYFLGMFLFEKKEKVLEIIDGQQRFTTIFIILYHISNFLDNNDLKNLIYLSSKDKTFRLALQDGQNADYFRKMLEGQETKEEYISQKKLKNVFEKLKTRIDDLNEQDAKDIIENIKNSKILIYLETNTGKAMQIFELLNDRGKPLTELEALKSFIMHQVYIKADNIEGNKEELEDSIKSEFSSIYEILNKIADKTNKINEDDILKYHFIAFEKNGYKSYKKKDVYLGVKEEFKKIIRDEKTTENIIDKVRNLKQSFKFINEFLEDIHSSKPKYKWLKNLYILGNMATFYPLLLSLYKNHKVILDKVCNYLELFSFRTFAIHNRRTDAGLSVFYKFANNIHYKQIESYNDNKQLKETNSDNIIYELKEKIYNYTDEEKAFELGLRNPNFYKKHKGMDGRYLFIKYENYLVNEGSKKSEKRPISDISKILKTPTKKGDLSLDHIVAQNLDKDKENEIIESIVRNSSIKENKKLVSLKNKHNKVKYFKEEFMHSIGNLVISNSGSNSAKSNDAPYKKMDYLDTYLSQEEIKEMMEKNLKKNKNEDEDSVFLINDIEERKEKIIEFAKDYWNINYLYNEDDDEYNKSFSDISKRPVLI